MKMGSLQMRIMVLCGLWGHKTRVWDLEFELTLIEIKNGAMNLNKFSGMMGFFLRTSSESRGGDSEGTEII